MTHNHATMPLNTEQREKFTNDACTKAYKELGEAIALLADGGKSQREVKRTIGNTIVYLAHALAVM